MNITHLTYFKSLAENQHYSLTADELGIAQSSLSRSIAALEDELGVYLFEKHGRNSRLTKYGTVFYDYIKIALDQLEEGKTRVKAMVDPQCGEIKVGLIFSLGPKIMPDIVQRFTADEKNRGFRIRIFQNSTAYLINMLLEDKCDIALCSPPLIPNDRIRFEELLNRKIIAVVSTRHPFAKKDSIRLAELSEQQLIVSTDQTASLQHIFSSKGLPLNILSQIQGECAASGLAAVNYGIAILNTSVNFTGLDVKVLEIPELADYDFPLYMAQVKNRWFSPAVLAFRDFLLKGI